MRIQTRRTESQSCSRLSKAASEGGRGDLAPSEKLAALRLCCGIRPGTAFGAGASAPCAITGADAEEEMGDTSNSERMASCEGLEAWLTLPVVDEPAGLPEAAVEPCTEIGRAHV